MKETLMYEDFLVKQTSQKTMLSYRLSAPKTIEQVEVDLPEPGPGEVRIKLEGCGLCASSLPVWEGRPWFEYPLKAGKPGHEGYGTIDKTGPEVAGFQKGDRVTGLTYGSFADYDIAKADQVVKIPDTLKYMPLPGEPLGCAMNIFRRSKIKEGQHVAVIGAGFLGLLLIQLARQAGANVYAISQRPYSLEIAKSIGANEVLSLNEPGTAAKVVDLTSGKGCECVIEATGKQMPLDLASKIVGTRGKIVVAGYHQDGTRQVDLQLWNWKGIDVINAHERDPKVYIKGINEALKAIEECRLDVTPLFTHYFTPNRINEAFEILASRPEGFIKCILLFN